MNKAYVLLFDGYADWEIGLLLYELKTRNGIAVTTFSLTGGEVVSGGGLRVRPDARIEALEPDEIEILILPGGQMWESFSCDSLTYLVSELLENGRVVAAICGATSYLSKIGVFKLGYKHTSNSIDYLKETDGNYAEGDNYIQKYAVSDRNLVTASGDGGNEFAYEVLKTTKVYDAEVLPDFSSFWNCRDIRAI